MSIMLVWLLAVGCLHAEALISSVDTIGITVSDMDRSQMVRDPDGHAILFLER